MNTTGVCLNKSDITRLVMSEEIVFWAYLGEEKMPMHDIMWTLDAPDRMVRDNILDKIKSK